MKTITFTLTDKEAELVIAAIGRMPIATHAVLFVNLEQQKEFQLRQREVEKEPQEPAAFPQEVNS